ncbi:MAG: TRAP transporter small permease [Desulfobacterales bacterium]|nr:MAG: TRAP transporter small permease [Desulfobacterales bacterium]
MLVKLEKIFLRTNQVLLGVMMGLMFILVFLNVVTRYLLGFSFATAEEISTFLMIWITYIGAGLALREGRLAAIDLFQDLLPAQVRRAVRAFLGVTVLLFFAVLAFYGVKMVEFGWAQETWATQIPRGIPYLAVPIGAVVFGLHLVLMFRDWIDRQWGESPVTEESNLFEPEAS